MKTTIDISDALLEEARDLAVRENVTLSEIVERGLRAVIDKSRSQSQPFKLRDGSVMGKGLRPEFRGASWDKFLDAIYEGRGGQPS